MKGLSTGSVAAATILVVAGIIAAFGAAGAQYLLLAAAAVAAASIYFRKRIGGVTGDCFGATFQIVEIGTYALFLA